MAGDRHAVAFGADYGGALQAAIDAAREAARVLQGDFFRAGGPRGGGHSCPADAEAEALIRGRLREAFPTHGMRGEELRDHDRGAGDANGHVWLIDPQDGTSAMLKGHRGSAVSIGLLRVGRPVLGVVLAFAAPQGGEDLITWVEGCGRVTRNGRATSRAWSGALSSDQTVTVSQSGDDSSTANAELAAPARFRTLPSVAYRLGVVAAGEGEAGVSIGGACDWDYGAAHALLVGAGGDLLDAGGWPITYDARGVSGCGGRCFGGSAGIAAELAARDWQRVYARGAADASRYGLLDPAPGRVIDDAHLLDRAQGCLLGQLAGDALGSLVEFGPAGALRSIFDTGPCELIDGGTWGTIAGQPTDDSELALMLARSLASRGEYDPAETAAGYAAWLASGPFDVGGTTRQALSPAAQAVRAGHDPAAAARAAANHHSQANGSLMRVSPLGIFAHAVAPDRAAEWARADAALTHPHPACADAGAVFTAAIAHAIRSGDSAEAVYRWTTDWARTQPLDESVRQWLTDAATQPPADFISHMGWVRIAFQNAFYRLLHSPTVEEGIVETVTAGGDTDTNAAIAGALLGAVHGGRSLPPQWIDRLLTCRPIAGLPTVHRPRPRDYWPVDALLLAERLLSIGQTTAS